MKRTSRFTVVTIVVAALMGSASGALAAFSHSGNVQLLSSLSSSAGSYSVCADAGVTTNAVPGASKYFLSEVWVHAHDPGAGCPPLKPMPAYHVWANTYSYFYDVVTQNFIYEGASEWEYNRQGDSSTYNFRGSYMANCNDFALSLGYTAGYSSANGGGYLYNYQLSPWAQGTCPP
jgi:hypothetical protein